MPSIPKTKPAAYTFYYDSEPFVMKPLQATNLRVQKGKQEILHGLSLSVKAGTITGLIGPSGSGKTTLMRAIVGVQKYSGELHVLSRPAGSSILRSKIGYVTQSPAVYGDLTILQNLEYFAAIAGVPKVKTKRVIEQVQLTSHMHQLVDSLSGGQRARVSLAVALLSDPELLILDEPTVGLDPILRRNLWHQFAELAKAGKTLLISSHVMDEAEQCDELILVRDGQVLWNDSRTKLLNATHTSTVGDAFIAMISHQDEQPEKGEA
ncbi:MAG TPA: ABC transporter ATP-binding protein [Dongiaceae bacterium]|nr:ABC transporter ATP-binding protein [Dongiaceae bacterium]